MVKTLIIVIAIFVMMIFFLKTKHPRNINRGETFTIKVDKNKKNPNRNSRNAKSLSEYIKHRDDI